MLKGLILSRLFARSINVDIDLRLPSAEDPSSVCKKGGYNYDQKYHQHRHDAYTTAATTTIIVSHYRFLPAWKSNIGGRKNRLISVYSF